MEVRRKERERNLGFLLYGRATMLIDVPIVHFLQISKYSADSCFQSLYFPHLSQALTGVITSVSPF